MTPRERPSSGGIARRELLALGVGAFVVASVPFALARRPRAHRRTVLVMGTVADCVVVCDDAARADAALAAAVRELRRTDVAMTRFAATSDVGRANLSAGGEPVAVGAETAAVVRSALAWAERTDGRFDPCLGRAYALWADGTPPADTERVAAQLAGARLWRSLDVDRRAGRDVVRLARAESSLDLGGIAKGHAVDRALAAIRAHGIDDALVNAGGDLAAAGRSGDGVAWRVGVRDPARPDALCDVLDVSDAAVATSGDYERGAERDGLRLHHLVDPRTARPYATSAGTHSLTIVAADCTTADAAATALFGLRRGDPLATRLLAGTGARIAGSA